MDGKIFVLLIIAIVFGFAALGRWQKGQMADNSRERDEVDAKTRAELDDLRARIEVLERIATDKGSRLKEEIDAL